MGNRAFPLDLMWSTLPEDSILKGRAIMGWHTRLVLPISRPQFLLLPDQPDRRIRSRKYGGGGGPPCEGRSCLDRHFKCELKHHAVSPLSLSAHLICLLLCHGFTGIPLTKTQPASGGGSSTRRVKNKLSQIATWMLCAPHF